MTANRLPTATIIILNWNGLSYLETCLNALFAQTHRADKVVLVDNDSTDDSVDLVRQAFPGVEILQNEINLGYAGGNNAALRRLETDVAVLLNPDIVLDPQWLVNMLSAFKRDDAIGIAGCKLLFPGAERLQHAGGVITHPRAMPEHRGLYDSDSGQFDVPVDVDFVTGAAIAVRAALLEHAGLLDEGFFMYFEDADWCARARRSGFRVAYISEASAVHDESAFAVRGSPAYLRNFHTGRWRFLLKHFPAQEIVTETLPQEVTWLASISGEERLALGWAYRDTMSAFPEIMAAREAHGMPGIDVTDQEAINSGLLALRQDALRQVDSLDVWPELYKAGQIQPRPFASSAPLLGPLFAWLRDIWASVAVKPYTASLARQQNDFNQAFVEELQAIENRLQKLEAIWLQREADQRQMRWDIRELQDDLDESYRLLDSIVRRLASAETAQEEE